MRPAPAARHGLVLTAAGGSSRFGRASKVLADLAGIPVLVRAATPFRAAIADLDVVVTTSATDRDRVTALAASSPVLAGARVVLGGATRGESVRLGVAALADGVEWVLVHDAARPCASAALILRVLGAAKETGAAAPGLPVRDTVHRVGRDGLLAESLRRDGLHAMQTPQAARRDLLERAFAHAGSASAEATDEAGLLAAAGIDVRVVEGDPADEKITTRDDLARLAERLSRTR